MKTKIRLKIAIVLIIALGIIHFLSREEELTPRKIYRSFQRTVEKAVHKDQPTGVPRPRVTTETKVHSLRNTVKRTLYYDGVYFEMYVNPEIELTQDTLKLLYDYHVRAQQEDNR